MSTEDQCVCVCLARRGEVSTEGQCVCLARRDEVSTEDQCGCVSC